MSEDNKAISRRAFEEAFSAGNLDVLDELFAADFVGHDPALPEDLHGPGGMRQVVGMYRDAFPDLRITVDDQLAEGDEVATRFTGRGTHQGELMGVPPSGNQVTLTGIVIDRFSGGQIMESWVNYDALGMLQQIGAVPPPGQQSGS